jgi:acyl-lipid omega-6 desaturase (Delta-12 desaturase)
MPATLERAQRARTPSLRIARTHLEDADMKRSTVRGVIAFAGIGAGYLMAFSCAAAVPWWSGKLVAALAVAFFSYRLALLGHDAGHGSLTASAWLNRWMGRLVFLPSYVPYASWLANHNALHHAYTNLRGKDPLWPPLSKQEYDSLSLTGRAWERCCRSFVGVALGNIRAGWQTLVFPGSTVLGHIPNRFAFALERLAVLAFFAGQVAAIGVGQRCVSESWELPLSGFLAAVLLPTLVLNWWTGLMAFLHHTHPRVRWYADMEEWRRAQAGPVCAVHVVAPWLLDWLLGYALDHSAHHVAPKTPSAGLAASQHRLESAFPEMIERVNLFDCLRILAHCKLYDYENHCWVDYNGTPMDAITHTPDNPDAGTDCGVARSD